MRRLAVASQAKPSLKMNDLQRLRDQPVEDVSWSCSAFRLRRIGRESLETREQGNRHPGKSCEKNRLAQMSSWST